MKITNAKIKNVTVGIDDNGRLSATMNFVIIGNLTCKWVFVLEDPAQVQRFKVLMDYAGANNIQDLTGRIIRVANQDVLFFRGFGHPIEDRFVPCIMDYEVKEVTETELAEILKRM